MIEAINRWLDRRLPSELLTGSVSMRRRARLCVSLPLVSALASASAVVVQTVLGRPPLGVVVASCGALTALLCSQLVIWTRSVRFAGHATVGAFFVFVTANAVIAGGLGAPRALGLLVIPMLATLLIDWRGGVSWLVACLVEVGVLLGLGVLAPSVLPEVASHAVPGAHAAVIAILMIFSMLTLASYDRAQASVTDELEAQRRRAEEERRRADDASRMKSALIANVSHELRTPLNGILGSTELLSTAGLGDAAREHVGTIEDAGEGLLRLIDDLLDTSRLEAGGMALEQTAFELRQTIGAAMRPLAPLAERRGPVRLVLHVEPDVPEAVVGDPFRLRQVITNLVNNAIKFTDQGHVCVRLSTRGRRVRFEVRDTGVGIAPEDRERLFEAFEQLSGGTARRHGGTGLGLDIARRLVALMGGQLELQSEVGVGSSFGFDIDLGQPDERSAAVPGAGVRVALALADPLESDAAAAALTWAGCELVDDGEDVLVHDDPALSREAAVCVVSPSELGGRARSGVRVARPFAPLALSEAVGRAASGASSFPPPSAAERGAVLVADDTPLNRKVVAGQLVHLGFDPVVVEDGAGALARVESGASFVAVMLDVRMPGMDGYETARAIRAWEREQDRAPVPLFALTAFQSAEHHLRATEAGFDRFLVKPLRIQDLEAVLRVGGPGSPAISDDSWTGLEQMAGGSDDFLSQLVRDFLVHSEERVRVLDHGGDVEAVAHSLRGASSQLGALALADACRALEESPERLDELLPRIRHELARARVDLESRVAARAGVRSDA